MTLLYGRFIPLGACRERLPAESVFSIFIKRHSTYFSYCVFFLCFHKINIETFPTLSLRGAHSPFSLFYFSCTRNFRHNCFSCAKSFRLRLTVPSRPPNTSVRPLMTGKARPLLACPLLKLKKCTIRTVSRFLFFHPAAYIRPDALRPFRLAVYQINHSGQEPPDAVRHPKQPFLLRVKIGTLPPPIWKTTGFHFTYSPVFLVHFHSRLRPHFLFTGSARPCCMDSFSLYSIIRLSASKQLIFKKYCHRIIVLRGLILLSQPLRHPCIFDLITG